MLQISEDKLYALYREARNIMRAGAVNNARETEQYGAGRLAVIREIVPESQLRCWADEYEASR